MSSRVFSSVPTSNRGTAWVQYTPWTEIDNGLPSEFEAISADSRFADYSYEELRLVDYQDGRGNHSAETDARTFNFFSSIPLESGSVVDCKPNLALLRGPGIDICVGIPRPMPYDSEFNTGNTWCLPKKLISYYSPFLKAACERNFKERRENRINLPDDEVTVFALFVEWIYYGSYNVPPTTLKTADINAKCWVFGDKLLCTEFKNYAMSCLYKQYTLGFFVKPVTLVDVRYVCANSAIQSRLRKFYLALFGEYFENPCRVLGTIEDWGELLQEETDLRLLVLRKLRKGNSIEKYVLGEKAYMEPDDEIVEATRTLQISRD